MKTYLAAILIIVLAVPSTGARSQDRGRTDAQVRGQEKSLPTRSKKESAQVIFEGVYDFRGLRLGMSLDEFKSQDHRLVTGSRSQNQLRAVCSGESDPNGIYLNETDFTLKRLGGVSCSYMDFSEHPYDSGILRWKGARIVFPGGLSEIYKLKFAKNRSDEQLRLFDMFFLFDSDSFDDVVIGLTRKFGKHQNLNKELVQNLNGATFENEKYRWENDKGYVMIMRYSNKITKSLLVIADKEISSFYLRERDRMDSSDPSKNM